MLFNLSSRFALSGGVGYITGKYSAMRTGKNQEGLTTARSGINQKAKAVPVTLGIYYYLPVSSKSRVYINAGAGYYFARFSSSSYRENDTPYKMDTDTTGSGGDVCFHGGSGFEYHLAENVAIVIEGFGRYAKISGFKGTRNQSDSNNWSDSLDATHYHYAQYAWTEEWLPRTGFGTEPPSGENIRNVRDYETDFTGYTLKLGLKIKLL
ncbi:MAG: outer membrane beta-barrel protein [Candidatus Aminicenantes bacterium]|nr:MAG: outer membrane beta-barrel protein [Candidatus Aminicenantes bacterium]